MSKVYKSDKTYTGVVMSVNTNENVFRVKRCFWSARQFACGRNCEITPLYVILKDGVGTPGGLRPGEKVTVSYQDAHGVLIADWIEQRPMQFAGTVIHSQNERTPERCQRIVQKLEAPGVINNSRLC